VRVGMGTMAALSAPTAMAVSLARQSGLQLFAFCRPGSLVAYTAEPA
jgi:FdhD protein